MIKVMILNPYLFTLGGGEKQMGYLCKFIEEYFNNEVIIDIIVHNIEGLHDYNEKSITIDMLNGQYNLDLKCTRVIITSIKKPLNKIEFLKEKKKIEKLTEKYDIFINFKFMSKHQGRAKINIYECMFPPKTFKSEMSANSILRIIGDYFDKKFCASYDMFLLNSKYSLKWLEKFWKGKIINTHLTYPPVFCLEDIHSRYKEQNKANKILSVGRFFKGAHCKKQKEMIMFFINNIEIFKDYEYHLAGAVSGIECDMEYLKEIQELIKPYNNIFIHENCGYEELMDLYKSSKIFWHATGYMENEELHPEKMEHFGITTVEAMSFGVVPVVIGKGGQPEIVEDGINGFLWMDENRCISKTKELFNDAFRRQLAENAVKKSKFYSIEGFMSVHKELFDILFKDNKL